jgi:pyruvate/2-oxoglutarate dehydrogenase complex dihydrolipoamide dehydrogenase (E3) component
MIDGLCQRYSCLPSELLAEDAHWILTAHALMKEAGDDDNGE